MKQYVLSIFRQTETHRPRRAREGDGKTCARSTRRYAPLALGCSRAAARAEHGDRAQSLLAGPTLRVVIIAADLGCAIADLAIGFTGAAGTRAYRPGRGLGGVVSGIGLRG